MDNTIRCYPLYGFILNSTIKGIGINSGEFDIGGHLVQTIFATRHPNIFVMEFGYIIGKVVCIEN